MLKCQLDMYIVATNYDQEIVLDKLKLSKPTMVSMCHMYCQLDDMKSIQSKNSSPTYYMYARNRVVKTPIDFALEVCSQ